MSVATTGFSELSVIEEICVIIDEYVIGLIGIIAAIYYLICIKNKSNSQNNNNKYYHSATSCAIVSFICSILVFSLKLFFGNDLLIPHNGFVSNKSSFVSTVDTLIIFFFAIEKLCVYYGFTFHSQSLTNKKTISCFLKFWMVGTVLVVTAACTIYVLDDALFYTSKEIGITNTYNFHITMYLGHQGAGLVSLFYL